MRLVVGIAAVLASLAFAAPASAATPSDGPSKPKAALAATICNKYCDGRDPALSPGDRQPVRATVFSLNVILHVDAADAMAWASIDNGNAADEVWLDRSFDGGRTWASG